MKELILQVVSKHSQELILQKLNLQADNKPSKKTILTSCQAFTQQTFIEIIWQVVSKHSIELVFLTGWQQTLTNVNLQADNKPS